MKSGSYFSILKIVLHGRSAGNILLATLLSFTFSIAVILCTFGLMDGFDHLLKSGLRHSSGDILITSRKGFFSLDRSLQDALAIVDPEAIAPVIQTEAFLLASGQSKGVLVRGVESDNFSTATGLKIHVSPGEIVLGSEIAEQLKLKVGDEIALTLSRGNEAASQLPSVKIFKIVSVVEHGIYQKDLRFVYLARSELADLIGTGEKVNLVILSLLKQGHVDNLEEVTRAQERLRSNLETGFFAKPFWSEYSFLIEAVKVEKFSISLILQLIVVIAVFNIMAFVIYIMEKKAQDFFFLRAIGLDLKSLMKFWTYSVVVIWFFSCVGAYFLSHLFNWGLQHIPFLQIPGEIYVLSSLSIKLNPMSYFTVYSLALLWVFLAAFFGYLRLKRRPIMEGLRQEFSA